jgi:hypothetical protein
MPFEVKLEFDMKFIQALQKFIDIDEHVKTGIKNWYLKVDGIIQRDLATGKYIKSRHGGGGGLADSMNKATVQVNGGGSRYEMLVTSLAQYARILDEGGTIKSKGKKLTVPFKNNINFTPTGILRKTAAEWMQQEGATKIWKSKKGTPIIWLLGKKTKRGKQKPAIPLFSLKDEVTIPPKKWFQNAVKDAAFDFSRILKETIEGNK